LLNQQDANMGLGSVQWELVAGLFTVTLICFFSLSFGKRILAKVTWVTVISPVVLLLVLLVSSAQLEGASDGINFYVGKFDASLLADAELWATACGQILFSLSPGFGTAITMSSYTHPKENVFRICIFVSLANSVFSIVGGFAIFSVLGNLALTTGTTVAEVASSGGTGLAFVAIAEGITNFGDARNVISVLFFAMLLLLGLDSSFAWIETFASYCEDLCHARGMHPQKWQIMAVLCTVFFLCGITFCTQGGNQLLDIMDHYCTSYFLLLGCCLESVMFTVDFGWSRFVHAVTDATGDKLYGAAFWKLSLFATTPLATGCLFLQLLISDLKKPYNDYPAGFQAVGWITLVTCVALSLATCLRKGNSTLPSMASK
jgi:SNF family Na+-dependent transporter